MAEAYFEKPISEADSEVDDGYGTGGAGPGRSSWMPHVVGVTTPDE